MKKNSSGAQGTTLGAGIAIGIGIGTALGVAMDNLAAGIGIGIAIGAGIALLRWIRRGPATKTTRSRTETRHEISAAE